MKQEILKVFINFTLQLYKVFNLIKLWIFSENKFLESHKLIKENLLSDRETLLYLKKNPNVGIIRNGNSELGLMVGNSPKTQKYNKELRDRLVKSCQDYNSTIMMKNYILELPLESLVLSRKRKRGIPDWHPGKAASLAMRLLVKKDQIYARSCFRITEVLDDNMDDYIKLLESLFTDRDIIYVGPSQGKNSEVPKFMKYKEFLEIPEKNSYNKFNEILLDIKKLCKNYNNPLVVLVGGTTASALSYELNMSNITCYDFGQYNRLYKKYLESKR